MNQRQKLHRFAQERDVYLQECREEYGYLPRARARTISANHGSNFISTLFGCALLLAIYTTFDFRACWTMIESLQQVSMNDIYTLASNLMG